jgi:uncharacterized heparinase superfamily protein
VTPAQREPSLTDPESFLFLGEHGRLADVGWNGPQREKLWRYNQHYFDDLNARQNQDRIAWHLALVSNWVQHNPPGLGDGWEPYPTSLRIVNWVKWALAGHPLPDICVISLAVQARWLRQRLEIHLLGNHLFANAKALVFAGLFFDGPEAQGWLQKGFQILAREVPEQVLSDGGHFERSTMYHALALEDLLDICNLLACHEDALPEQQRAYLRDWRNLACQMQRWLHSMCHPDGEISFFNDAALGIAPTPLELNEYAARLGLSQPENVTARWLDKSGYARLQSATAVALLDMAPVGPDYLPGHAHADTLSFELSVHGQRLLVNSGTSCYGMSPERLRQRGTAAHNTVVVNGEDSSEVWGSFRVARRARPISPNVLLQEDSQEAHGSHDGYTRLPGRPIHKRRWTMRRHSFRVDDHIKGPHHSAQARFHVHPYVRVRCEDDGCSGAFELPNGQIVHWTAFIGQAQLIPSSWHPRFGSSLPSQCLVVNLVNGSASLQLSWTD